MARAHSSGGGFFFDIFGGGGGGGGGGAAPPTLAPLPDVTVSAVGEHDWSVGGGVLPLPRGWLRKRTVRAGGVVRSWREVYVARDPETPALLRLYARYPGSPAAFALEDPIASANLADLDPLCAELSTRDPNVFSLRFAPTARGRPTAAGRTVVWEFQVPSDTVASLENPYTTRDAWAAAIADAAREAAAMSGRARAWGGAVAPPDPVSHADGGESGGGGGGGVGGVGVGTGRSLEEMRKLPGNLVAVRPPGGGTRACDALPAPLEAPPALRMTQVRSFFQREREAKAGQRQNAPAPAPSPAAAPPAPTPAHPPAQPSSSAAADSHPAASDQPRSGPAAPSGVETRRPLPAPPVRAHQPAPPEPAVSATHSPPRDTPTAASVASAAVAVAAARADAPARPAAPAPAPGTSAGPVSGPAALRAPALPARSGLAGLSLVQSVRFAQRHPLRVQDEIGGIAAKKRALQQALVPHVACAREAIDEVCVRFLERFKEAAEGVDLSPEICLRILEAETKRLESAIDALFPAAPAVPAAAAAAAAAAAPAVALVPSVEAVLDREIQVRHRLLTFEESVMRLQALWRGRECRRQFRAMIHRVRVCREILDAEEEYVHRLDLFVRLFQIPLSEKSFTAGQIIPASQITTIFSNIGAILSVNREFLDALRAIVQDGAGSLADAALSPAFLRSLPTFTLYIEYVKSADESARALAEAARVSRFAEFVKETIRANPEIRRVCVGTSLDSLQILPVQRIPRYVLLLRELLKWTPPDHPDYAGLADAKTGMEGVARKINETKRISENLRKFVAIEARLRLPPSFPGSPLMQPHRRFLKEGALLRQKNARGTLRARFSGAMARVCLFLFSDIILLAEKGGLAMDYAYRKTIFLERFELVDAPRTESGAAFVLADRKSRKKYTFIGDAVSIQTWSACISDAICSLSQREESRRRASMVVPRPAVINETVPAPAAAVKANAGGSSLPAVPAPGPGVAAGPVLTPAAWSSRPPSHAHLAVPSGAGGSAAVLGDADVRPERRRSIGDVPTSSSSTSGFDATAKMSFRRSRAPSAPRRAAAPGPTPPPASAASPAFPSFPLPPSSSSSSSAPPSRAAAPAAPSSAAAAIPLRATAPSPAFPAFPPAPSGGARAPPRPQRAAPLPPRAPASAPPAPVASAAPAAAPLFVEFPAVPSDSRASRASPLPAPPFDGNDDAEVIPEPSFDEDIPEPSFD